MDLSRLGSTRTGAIINITRLFVVLLSLIFFVLAVIVGVRAILAEPNLIDLSTLYLGIGFFAAGLILLVMAAWFKVQSQPFLLPDILYKQMERKDKITDVESFLKTYKAQVGVAGFFNRLGFSGLSLGTIASAFLILLVGMLAIQLRILPDNEFSVFSDLAKLLFGAFIGSFANERRGKTETTTTKQ